MIVEDQLDGRVGRVSRVEKLEEFDELAAAMAFLYQGMDLAGEEINPGEQAERAVALVLVVTRKARKHARLGRQIRPGGCDRLDARLLVIGDNHRRLSLLLLSGGGFLEDSDLAVDAQYLRHPLLEVGVATFQVVAYLVRLDDLPVEDFAHRSLGKLSQAVMPLRRPMLARMARQEPGRPQLMRIAKLLRLATSKIHQPCPRRGRNGGLLAGSWPIIKCFQRTIGNGSLDAALNRLMMHAESMAYGEEGRVFAISQKHSRPLDMACRLRSRPSYPSQAPQVLLSNRQFQHLTPR